MFRTTKGGNEWKKIKPTTGERQKLSDKEIASLAKTITKIEKHFGFPVDVEWAKAGDEFFILQSRPITTLADKSVARDRRPAMQIRNNDYKVLFKLKGRLTCLHAEFFARGSMGLGDPVIVFKNGDWHTFINRKKEQLCLQKGLEIFSSEEAYKEYADGFRSYIAMANEKIVPRFTKPVCPTKEELQELLPILQKEMYFYGITEFSYHDLAYEKYLETKDPVLKRNLDDLGKLKFEGRAMLNAYIFETGVFHNLLQGISRKFLKHEDDGEFLFISELLGLYDGIEVPEEIIHERRHVYGCTSINGEVTIFSKNEALRVWDELHSDKASDIITGTTANQGKASGRVVIAPMLVSPKAISEVAAKMNKGDILVAESTTPELMSLCNKAAAIVTDQGGMLSHAAIVSRELNVPCIIGAGTATEVLRDGDIVEVDATAGVVRILSQWTHHLTRPYTLLGAGLWLAWYDSQLLQELTGARIKDALFIEEHPNVVKFYMQKAERKVLIDGLKQLATEEHDQLSSIFKKGFALNKKAEAALKKGKDAFSSFEEGVNFMIELALHATVLPNMGLRLLVDLKVENQKLIHDAEQLRAVSLYPKIITDCIIPHVIQQLHGAGIKNAEKAAELVTLREMRSGNFSQLSERLQNRESGQKFLYQIFNGEEVVQWVPDTKPRIMELEGLRELTGSQKLHGQVAYRGKVQGVARLVLSDDGKGVTFNDGDILVSINSNPTMMPLILKCSAIVTDEGGAGCHAAIISRELKKPCVIGTKHATALIKDGDRLNVDAEQGTVTIIGK